MSAWTKHCRMRRGIIALTLSLAALSPAAAQAEVSVSIGVPGFWGYYAPPPPPVYYGYAYYGYPYGYAYYGYQGPYYWYRPWHRAHFRHRHWHHWR